MTSTFSRDIAHAVSRVVRGGIRRGYSTAMPQANAEIVGRMAEAWAEGGWQSVADQGLLDPEVEYHDDRRWPEARSTVGTSALVERFVEYMEVLGKDATAEVETVLDAGGDVVVMVFRLTGEARASGLRHDHRWGFLCRVSEQRITYIQAYLDPREALEAAGLSG
jgi:ketosteroid isomerase-like protein